MNIRRPNLDPSMERMVRCRQTPSGGNDLRILEFGVMDRSTRSRAVWRWLGWTVVMSCCMVALKWTADSVGMPHGLFRGVIICGISGAVASICFPHERPPT